METKMKTSLTEDELKDKVKGIIYGAALGDAVGLATEFMTKKQAKPLYGNGPIKFGKADGHEFWRDSFRSRWFENDFTDDTDQHLLILQCLLADNGTLNPKHFAYRVKEWTNIGFPELNNKLPSGIGLTVGSTCSHKELESDPLRASYDIWNRNNRNLAANGAVMRTGVLGASYFWDERKVVENAMMAAKVTHADPRSVTSAVIVSAIISRLLRGSAKEEISPDNLEEDKKYFTELVEQGSTEKSTYLEKFSHFPPPQPKPVHYSIQRQALRQFRRVTAYVTGQPVNPLFDQFEIPQHAPSDKSRLENPVPIRPDVKSMDEFGEDENMMKICRDVVEKYKFLVEGHSLCPSSGKGTEFGKEDVVEMNNQSSWVDELYQHCFPDCIASLKLDEPKKIGYTFKCLGAGLYLGTRKKPEEMTDSQFFEHIITELLLETGDADTNCTVAGAILGCRLGKSGLPKKWVDGLRHQKFLENISNDLCKMVLGSMNE